MLCGLQVIISSHICVSEEQKLKCTALVYVVEQRHINRCMFGLDVSLILVIVMQNLRDYGAWLQRECVASACRALNI